jgi:hypothetical protein
MRRLVCLLLPIAAALPASARGAAGRSFTSFWSNRDATRTDTRR